MRACDRPRRSDRLWARSELVPAPEIWYSGAANAGPAQSGLLSRSLLRHLQSLLRWRERVTNAWRPRSSTMLRLAHATPQQRHGLPPPSLNPLARQQQVAWSAGRQQQRAARPPPPAAAAAQQQQPGARPPKTTGRRRGLALLKDPNLRAGEAGDELLSDIARDLRGVEVRRQSGGREGRRRDGARFVWTGGDVRWAAAVRNAH